MSTRAALLCAILTMSAAAGDAQDGAAVYQKHCAGCHDSGRAASREAMKRLSPERIRLTLESGTMMIIGSRRTAAERRALAEYLSTKSFGTEPGNRLPQEAFCADAAAPLADNLFSGPSWNGWGAGLANQRFQTAAGIRAEDVAGLHLKWAFGFPDDIWANAQPAVAGGRVFVGSAGGRIYSLNAATGCIYWALDAEAPVRTAISIGSAGSRKAIYFGDLHGNVYAADAPTGRTIWKVRVDDHSEARITGAPALDGDRLFVPVASSEELSATDPSYECCRFRGSVVALDAGNGKTIWKTYTISDAPHRTRQNKAGTQLWAPSGGAVWSAPTIDHKRRTVYVGTGNSYSDPPAATTDAILALDEDSGKIRWVRQLTAGDAFNLACPGADKSNCPDASNSDFDFGSSPILVELDGGQRILVAGQKSAVVHGLDPDHNGAVLWQKRVGRGGTLGGIQWGPAADQEKVYVAVSDLMRQITPTGLVLDSKTGGGLFAVRLANGGIAWSAPPPVCGDRRPCSPAQSAAVTLIPGAVFSGSSDGHLRAYSANDGKVLWDFDAVREFKTVNGVEARGGSFDGPGPVVAGGMLYVTSGYGAMGGIPGNVLLTFSVDGK
jgi:polyvinyl alcohol dehydrogenase (cytochrome)